MNQDSMIKTIKPSMVYSNLPFETVNSHRVTAQTWTNLSFLENRKPQITIGLPTKSIGMTQNSTLSFNSSSIPTPSNITKPMKFKAIQSNLVKSKPIRFDPMKMESNEIDTLSAEEVLFGRDSLMQKNNKEEHFYEYGRWSQKEEELFLQGMMMYGNDWKYVQKCVKTRSPSQTRSHAQKFFMKLRRQLGKSREYEMIKKTVCKIFTKILGNKFKPGNLSEFVVRMKNLLLSYDTNPMRVLHEKKHKILIARNILEGNFDDSSSILSYKPDQIFLIFKDKRRIAERKLKKETLNSKVDPSCINFVNINMVNNFSTHNYCEAKYGDLFGLHMEPIANNKTKDNTNQVNIFEEQPNNDNISFISFP